jgi:hypothetical protein
MTKRGDHAVDERLAADQPDRGVAGRLPGQVLAAAEADLEPVAGARGAEQRCEVERRTRRQVDRQRRQQLVEQPLLGSAQRPAAPPAVEAFADALSGRPIRFAQANAARSGSTRSVRSQLKPPSASGARPKCP